MKRMTNILSLIISIALVGFLLIPANAVAECSGYYRINNVSINDVCEPFPIIKVPPGQQIIIDIDFSLANREGCPACIRQIVVGIDETPIGCVYHGIPQVCRNGETTGSGTISFTAPTSPGLYIIYALDMAQYTCAQAMALYLEYFDRARAICAIEVIGPEECLPSCSVYNVSINNVSGKFPIVDVSPGQQVTVDMDFSLANRGGCPACIRQIVVGIDDTAIDCVYNGIPQVCTNGETTGSGTVSFEAPSSPGVYIIYAYDMAQYTCIDALALYPEASYAYAGAIGAIKIAPPEECPPSCSVYNVSINNVSGKFPIVDVSPGQQVTVDMDFSLANRGGCPACIRQIVVGIDDTAIDCVYNGIPQVCTNGETTGSGTVSFEAPSSPGVYIIYAHDMAQYTCGQAMALYPEESYAYAGMIGAIKIQECPGDFDGDGDVDGSDLSVFSSDFGRTDCLIPGL